MAKKRHSAPYKNGSLQKGYNRNKPRIKRKKKATTIAVPLVVVAVFVVMAVVGAQFVGPYLQRLQPEPKNEIAQGVDVTFTIPNGAGAGQIAEILLESKLIESSSDFMKQAMNSGKDSQFKPGTYQITGGATVEEIIDVLVEGNTGNQLVIPEGYTIKQIAEVVKKSCDISTKSFTKAANSAEDYEAEFPFLKGAYKGSMEGFLFPSTYTIPFDAKADDVIRMMLTAYQNQIASVDMSAAQKRDMSSYDVLTLASIIEKESGSDKDKKKIASVFVNRLKSGINLGSDVTTYYGLGKDLTDGELTQSEIESDNPYNTRNPNNVGLPPSPICNPGLASLEAAANPADTDYYYFFYSSQKDKVMFYETLDEFNAAWAEYQ